jgi:putative DNA primase/helicase
VTMDAAPTDCLLRPASSIKPERIRWLWPGWLAEEKISILAGNPGAGKTTIATDLAAVVSVGGTWPDGAVSPVGDVAIWTGEDGIADTVIPRLSAAGADMGRVHIVGDEARSFDPARDMAALEAAIIALAGAIKLLVLDPLVAVIGAADSHKNSETRAALAPLAAMAKATGIAILGIHHLSKGTAGRDPTERLSGSLAFGAVARVVLIAAQAQGADGAAGERVLMRSKSNIGPDNGGFRYEIVERPIPTDPTIASTAVRWGDRIDGRARDVLADAEGHDGEAGGGSALNDAAAFLRDTLSGGPVAVPAIRAAATDAGLSWATVRRAKDTVEVEARKSGMASGWTWALRRGSSAFEEAHAQEAGQLGDGRLSGEDAQP